MLEKYNQKCKFCENEMKEYGRDFLSETFCDIYLVCPKCCSKLLVIKRYGKICREKWTKPNK